MEIIRDAVEGLNLTLVYGGFALAGLLFCGLAFIFGGDGGDGGVDADGDGGGCFLSPISLAFFTTSLGAFGLIFLHGLGISPMRSILYSIVAAALSMSVLSFSFYRLFVRGGAVVRAEKVDGLSAEVFTAITEGGVGEVLYRDGRGQQKALARSSDGGAIPAGVPVRIDRRVGPTLVVSRVEHKN